MARNAETLISEVRAYRGIDSEKLKGDGGKGTAKKKSQQFARNFTTSNSILRKFAIFYDNFRLLVPLT